MKTITRKNPIGDCPLTAAWAAVGGKWKLTILYWLAEQPRHFAALRRQLDAVSDGISHKVLTQQLGELVADGILARERTGDVPAPVIYSLTEYGRTALPMVEVAQRWGVGHIERMQRNRQDAPGGTLSCIAHIDRVGKAKQSPALRVHGNVKKPGASRVSPGTLFPAHAPGS